MNKSKPPKLRIFAGPNGSGKTSLVNNFPSAIKLGIVVNADDIEKEFKQNGTLNITSFGIKFNKKIPANTLS